jgi:hypothetical protein
MRLAPRLRGKLNSAKVWPVRGLGRPSATPTFENGRREKSLAAAKMEYNFIRASNTILFEDGTFLQQQIQKVQ